MSEEKKSFHMPATWKKGLSSFAEIGVCIPKERSSSISGEVEIITNKLKRNENKNGIG